MTPAVRLTTHAEESLTDILAWTVRSFGPRQAVLYGEMIKTRLAEVSAGTLPDRSLADLAGPSADPRLRMIRTGEHFAVFLRAGTGIIVLDFLHGRSDIPARARDLPEPDNA